MSEVANITDQLQRVHESDAWHGPALLELLADLKSPVANAKPLPAAHSIHELLLHIAAWNEVFLSRLEGQRSDEPVDGDFPPPDLADSEAWEKAIVTMNSSHDRLVRKISTLSDSALDQIVVGKDYSVRFLLYGIIRHYVYHSGQIALLKKA
jgi:uncharacterized damage-inducible protein DinB